MAGTEFVFRIKGDASGAVSASNEAGKAVGGVKKEVGTLNDALGKMGTMVAGAFAVGSIIAFGKAVADSTAKLQSLQTRLEGIYGSASAAGKTLDSLRLTADKLGLDFGELANNFTQFVSAAKASGMEVSKAEKIFNNMSVAIAGSGASSEQASRAMTALTQMIGKGKISAEEMRGQLGEALPQAMGWLAKSLNMTVGEVGKLIDSGKLSTDVLMKFSATAAEAMGPNVQKMAEGLNGQINRMGNAWERFKQTVGDSGIIEASVSALTKTIEGASAAVALLTGNWAKYQTQQMNAERLAAMDEHSKKLDASLRKEIDLYETSADKIEAVNQKLAYFNGELMTAEANAKIEQRTNKMKGMDAATANNIETLKKNIEVTEAYRNELEQQPDSMSVVTAKTTKQIKEEQALAASIAKTTAELQKRIQKDMIAYALEHSGEKENMVGPQMTPEYQKSIEEKQKREADFYAEIDELEYRSNQHAMELADAEKDKQAQDLKDYKAVQAEKLQYGMQAAETLSQFVTIGYQQQENALTKSLASGAISQEQYAERMRALKKKEFIANKIAGILQIGINTAIGVSSALAAVATAPLAPFIAATGAAQAALVAAQPIPYAKGTKKVPLLSGAVRGKDSVHAILMPDERVVPADTNMMPGYHELLNDIQDRRISPDMAMFLHEAAAGRMVAGGGGRGLDEERLGDIFARAISRIPSPAFSIDERGVAVISQRAQFREQQIRRKL